MWTYLALLFSVLLLVGVFVRRAYLHFKADKKRVVSKKRPADIEEELVSKTVATKLSKKDKARAVSFCKKAEASLKAGKEDDAIKYFVQALAIDELHIETQHKLAMLYMQKKMYSAASALFKNLAELTGEAVHFSHLGLAMYQQSQFEEAKAAYQKAVDLDPSRPQRFVSLSQVYRSLGELQNSVIALNKAIEMDKGNIDYLFLLAEIQSELNNFNEAKEIINRVLKLEPKNNEAKEFLKAIEAREQDVSQILRES